MLTTLKRKILFWSSIVAFFALMPVVIAYALGYRFDESWRLRKTGGLYVTSDITGSEIRLDNRLIKTPKLFWCRKKETRKYSPKEISLGLNLHYITLY